MSDMLQLVVEVQRIQLPAQVNLRHLNDKLKHIGQLSSNF